MPLTCPKAVDLSEGAVYLSEGRRPVRCPKAVVPLTCRLPVRRPSCH